MNVHRYTIEDGIIEYYHFLSKHDRLYYYKYFEKHLNWYQDSIKMFGKKHKIPRLQAWYADTDKDYSYSGIKLKNNDWDEKLLEIKSKIENQTQLSFNSVLANLYRDGADSNGWHSDDEKELGRNPVIASLSLGEPRFFHLRRKADRKNKQKILLENGSLLVMKGAMQHFWQHQIAKTKKQKKARINLTFRYII